MEARIIKFDSVQHKYTDEIGNIYRSVTQLIGDFTPQFDEMYWLAYKALEKNHKVRPNVERQIINVDGNDYTLTELYDESSFISAGLQMECESIRREWKNKTKVAIDRGNETHEYFESCIKTFSAAPKVDISKLSNYADLTYRLKITSQEDLDNSPLRETHNDIYRKLCYFISQGFIIYAEKRVYSPIHLIAGTIDVFIVKGKEFYILDWKTNKKDLKFTCGYYKKVWKGNVKVETDEWVAKSETLLQPLSSIPNCKGGVYTIQLGTYAYICELWGLHCLGLELYHIKSPDDIKVYEIPYRKLDIQYMFEYRSKQLQEEAVGVQETGLTFQSKSPFGIR